MTRTTGAQEQYTLKGESYTIIKDTPRAVLVKIVDGEEHWLPKSQLLEWSNDCIVMSAWIAKEKGLIS